jgi:NADPH:quinone reductase-like Zn-dependent oxidoreductase
MPKVVRFHEYGAPEVLKIEDLPRADPDPGEVSIRVDAFGLNKADIFFRMGRYIEPAVLPSRLGYDACGVVEAVGEGVDSFQPGDKVLSFPAHSPGTYGVYGETAVLPARSLMPWPENLRAEEAAGVGVTYFTAYFALFEAAMLQPGRTILITAGSSGAGSAAIQMAKAADALVISTTRKAEKKQAVLDLGADHVIVSEEEDLGEAVAEIVGGKGLDVFYDAIAGDTLLQVADHMSVGGAAILYGFMQSPYVKLPLMPALIKKFSIVPYKVFDYTGHSGLGLDRVPGAVERAMAHIGSRLSSGKVKPMVAETFGLENIQEAHRALEKNAHVGKLVVKIS